nr:hypothetical protein [Gemmatimonadales bacterium]
VCGGPFVGALDLLERTLPGAARNAAGLAQWHDALGAVSRKLEASWLGLEGAADEEERAWASAIERVRTWRRPQWPLWIITAILLGSAAYLGLVLGGFVPVPAVLAPMANYWWRIL